MPNHVHILWRKQDLWIEKSIQQQFLKFTAQQIKFSLIANSPNELEKYKSTQADRNYHFWERRPYNTAMNSRTVLEQKLDCINNNPVKKEFCILPEDYIYFFGQILFLRPRKQTYYPLYGAYINIIR